MSSPEQIIIDDKPLCSGSDELDQLIDELIDFAIDLLIKKKAKDLTQPTAE